MAPLYFIARPLLRFYALLLLTRALDALHLPWHLCEAPTLTEASHPLAHTIYVTLNVDAVMALLREHNPAIRASVARYD